MEHGALSSQNLKDACFLAARPFGVNSKNLGRLLFEVTLINSAAGQRKSQFGGVCSISFMRWQQMSAHHQFLDFEKQIEKELGIQLNRIQFCELARNPNLSLIVTAAWFLANVNSIPKERHDRAKLYQTWWSNIPEDQYMELTKTNL